LNFEAPAAPQSPLSPNDTPAPGREMRALDFNFDLAALDSPPSAPAVAAPAAPLATQTVETPSAVATKSSPKTWVLAAVAALLFRAGGALAAAWYFLGGGS